MGIFPAGLGPCFINHAIIISIQERAWGRFQNVIFVFVDTQVFFNKIAGLHPEEFCNSFDIILIKYWTCRLAAIGAGQAIDLLKNFLMRIVKCIINQPGILLLEALQEFLITGSPIFRLNIEFVDVQNPL